MAKKSGKTKRPRPTPSSKRTGAGKRAKTAKRTARKTAGARTAKGKGRKTAASPARARKLKLVLHSCDRERRRAHRLLGAPQRRLRRLELVARDRAGLQERLQPGNRGLRARPHGRRTL